MPRAAAPPLHLASTPPWRESAPESWGAREPSRVYHSQARGRSPSCVHAAMQQGAELVSMQLLKACSRVAGLAAA